jgi:hypothetical protein
MAASGKFELFEGERGAPVKIGEDLFADHSASPEIWYLRYEIWELTRRLCE